MKGSLLRETSPSPTRSLMSCSCAPAGDIPMNNKTAAKANRQRHGRYLFCSKQLGFIWASSSQDNFQIAVADTSKRRIARQENSTALFAGLGILSRKLRCGSFQRLFLS